MQTLFISDLHLDASQPQITQQLFNLLDTLADDTERLYILGDLFEAWIGDDAPGAVGEQVMAKLALVVERGVEGHFAHGNRDFLVGSEFCQRTGFNLLKEETVIDCYGERVLLMHGDSLCTDDVEYQALRRTVRDPVWQEQILSLEIQQRIALAQQMRDASQSQMQTKSVEIMDVNQDEVESVMRKHGVTTMIHGHTHRPNIHRFDVDHQLCTRIVLGDWHEQGSLVSWSADGFALDELKR